MRDGVLERAERVRRTDPHHPRADRGRAARTCCWTGRSRSLPGAPAARPARPRRAVGDGVRIAERLASEDVQVMLVKDGDHRLSRPRDLALLRADPRRAPRRGWRLGPRDRSDSSHACRAPAWVLRAGDLAVLAQKLRAIGLMRAAASSNGIARRRRDAEQAGGLRHDVGALGRFVVGEVEHAHARPRVPARIAASTARAMSSRWMRPKAWPGLMIRRAVPRPQIVEHRTARPVNAGEPEQVDARSDRRTADQACFAHLAGAVLRSAARARVRRVLVHPAAAAIAVDAGGGQIADPAQRRAPPRSASR